MSSRSPHTGHLPSDATVDPANSRVPSGLTLQTMQRYSSYAFSGFLGLHFANTCIVPLTTWFSSKTAISNIDNGFMITRQIYRPTLAVESSLIFAPLFVHIACGVMLRATRIIDLYREPIPARHDGLTRISLINYLAQPHIRARLTLNLSDIAASGYITWLCVALHIYTVRNIPWKYAGEGETSITIVTYALQKHPVLFYTLYYTLISAGVFHVISGWGKWLELTGTPRAKRWKNYIVTAVNLLWLSSLIRVGRLEILSDALKAGYDTLYRYFWSGF
jgi:hypothetical protein